MKHDNVRITYAGKTYVLVPEVFDGEHACDGCALGPRLSRTCFGTLPLVNQAYVARGVPHPYGCSTERTICIPDTDTGWAEYLRQRVSGT